MPELPRGLTLLSAIITPAVLISACGTLIFSTSTRLSRIVDRVRALSGLSEQLFTGEVTDFVEERRAELERQLGSHAQRGRLIQRSLTSFYVSLGIFVSTTIAISLTALVPGLSVLPSLLGIAGTLFLFHGCVLLIGETRLALTSINAEMEFVLRLKRLYQERPPEKRARPRAVSGMETKADKSYGPG